jgi:hypothetical protein
MHRIGFVCVIVVQLLSAASEAEEGCEKFAWSLSRERAWFAASEKAALRPANPLLPFRTQPLT